MRPRGNGSVSVEAAVEISVVVVGLMFFVGSIGFGLVGVLLGVC